MDNDLFQWLVVIELLIIIVLLLWPRVAYRGHRAP